VFKKSIENLYEAKIHRELAALGVRSDSHTWKRADDIHNEVGDKLSARYHKAISHHARYGSSQGEHDAVVGDIKYFDQKVLPGLKNKNPGRYSHDDISDLVQGHKDKTVEKSGVKDIIYKDKTHTVVHADTPEKAQKWGCHHGQNAWCISSRQEGSADSFNSEVGGQGKSAYFMFDKSKEPGHPRSKHAILVKKGDPSGEYKDELTDHVEMWNANDHQTGDTHSEGFVKLPHGPAEAIKKHSNTDFSHVTGKGEETLSHHDEKTGHQLTSRLKDGVLHGRQTRKNEAGDYLGSRVYKAGKEHGQRKEYHSTGAPKYVGEFRNGEEHGQHQEFDRSGRISQSRSFKEGALHGPATAHHDDGSIKSKGSFHKGREVGHFQEFHPDGKPKKTVHYSDPGRKASQEEWHDNGQKASSMKFNEFGGESDSTHWNKKGDKTSETFVKGSDRTKREWHESGHMSSERIEKSNHTASHSPIEYKSWHENGQMKRHSPSDIDTPVREWHENGQIKSEKDQIENRHGAKNRMWDKKGQIQYHSEYTKDQGRTTQVWNDKGIQTKHEVFTGKSTLWNDKGQKTEEYHTDHGQRHGDYREFHDDGTLKKQGSMFFGKAVGTHTYNLWKGGTPEKVKQTEINPWHSQVKAEREKFQFNEGLVFKKTRYILA